MSPDPAHVAGSSLPVKVQVVEPLQVPVHSLVPVQVMSPVAGSNSTMCWTHAPTGLVHVPLTWWPCPEAAGAASTRSSSPPAIAESIVLPRARMLVLYPSARAVLSIRDLRRLQDARPRLTAGPRPAPDSRARSRRRPPAGGRTSRGRHGRDKLEEDIRVGQQVALGVGEQAAEAICGLLVHVSGHLGGHMSSVRP